eukprot:gnl/TRDRNA2_/TRDRNA2_84434_c0_seq1.p1 gnl/TRDRNA2_/TRDRNA2_84434_c0~~gnl/TRDRNA2_/TRDRNA2_84434_c0_seq1.p1  ORF type:complete len:223 (-),score=63.94 gnl/TRDRNA2_/TRDRNA2_84434_c0_seq1:50-718(-)
MQVAKQYAGELERSAEAAGKIQVKLQTYAEEAEQLSGFDDPAIVTKAERIMEKIEQTIAEGVVSVKKLESDMATVQPGPVKAGAAKQYYPLMYFIDKTYEDVYQTCSGKLVNKPISGLSKDGCASACDAEAPDCVGFAFFESPPDAPLQLCFLFSKFESATYYTGCPTTLLQALTGAAAKKATCLAKVSEFKGLKAIDLKPQGDGKCKHCLKTLKKSDRCFN